MKPVYPTLSFTSHHLSLLTNFLSDHFTDKYFSVISDQDGYNTITMLLSHSIKLTSKSLKIRSQTRFVRGIYKSHMYPFLTPFFPPSLPLSQLQLALTGLLRKATRTQKIWARGLSISISAPTFQLLQACHCLIH